MLLIGDIHTTVKRSKQLLASIRTYIARFPDEHHILFLGDYVYHFSYDRKALLELFQLFIELYSQGKSVYVLSGNHDRISGHFVFQEGKHAFDLLQSDQGAGKLYFITRPTFFTIEGQDCLLFPFFHPQSSDVEHIKEPFAELYASSHQGEQYSARACSLLWQLIEDWQIGTKNSEKLLVFHHRYIADTKFPGQKAVFSYKSPALSSLFLDHPAIMMVSGHIHKPFCLKNYLCVGSIRYTSPLECNQIKYCFRMSNAPSVEGSPLLINPALCIESLPLQSITEQWLHQFFDKVVHESRRSLEAGSWNVTIMEDPKLFLEDLSLTIESKEGTYEGLEAIVDARLIKTVADLKLKHPYHALGNVIEQLDTVSMELDKSISDRKVLLQRFLHAKYGTKAPLYEKCLYDLEIL